MRMMRGSKHLARLVVVIGSIAGTVHAAAHDQIPGPPQTQPIAIIGATIHPISRPPIERGTILFEGGKIIAIGTEVAVPDAALRIDGAGSHVYPGLIESMTDLGLREIGAVDVTLDSTETGSVNPNVRSWVALNPDSELIPVARANGILTAMVVPKGGWIRGQSAVMALDGWTAREMQIRAPAGMWFQWEATEPRGENEQDMVKAREDFLQRLDNLIADSKRYADARRANPEAVPTNLLLEGMLEVVEGRTPLFAHADRQSTIESAVLYAASRKLKLVIAGGYDAEACAELLKRYDVPVVITATYRLPLYRHDPYDAPYTLPARLHRAGVRFAICGDWDDSSNARNLPYHAANAVAYGLPEDAALRAVTLGAAEILSVSDQIGSLDVGKQATLIRSSGNVLESDTQILDAYIGGRKVDLSSRHRTLYEKYRQKYLQQKAAGS